MPYIAFMRIINYILILFVSPFIFSQNEVSNMDTIQKNERDLFIKDYKKQLNVKFDVSNNIGNYIVPFEGKLVNISPNLTTRYALDFSYKYVSVSFGFRPKASSYEKENKGESDVFRLRVKLLFDNWAHRFEYNLITGYYVKNTHDLYSNDLKSDRFVQFSNLRTSIFSGTTAYKINKNYSIRATESQTEIQLKSVGSIVPSMDYWIYLIDGADSYIDPQGELIKRDEYIDYQGLNTIFNIGYYYTFVYKKNWYANVFAISGAGMDIYKATTITTDEELSNQIKEFVLSFQAGAGLGYNSKSLFFGAEYKHKSTKEGLSKNDFNFHTTRNSFHVFVGYRFKAPKTIREPIDKFQTKVPLLQEK